MTTTSQLALHGRSNGGLLVGAVITQRPDLAGVALPAVGVLDMLRFHRFTIGAAWVSDYGDPDDPEQFADALAYSPLHNVRPGTNYPATLVMTGDHDDRVVPLHSHKFTAALQHAQAGARRSSAGSRRPRSRHGQAGRTGRRPNGPICWPSRPTTPGCIRPSRRRIPGGCLRKAVKFRAII